MRKVLVLALLLATSACGGGSHKGKGSTTTTAFRGRQPVECEKPEDASSKEVANVRTFKPVTPDTLTVVTSLPGAGFWDGSPIDPKKVNAGFEYDIAVAMQKAFGLSKLVVRNEQFDAITAGTLKKYDVALSQIAITCDRADRVTFSQPYYGATQGVLMKSGTKKHASSRDDLVKLSWGVQRNTTADDMLSVIKPARAPREFTALVDAYKALQAGQIDAVLFDTATNLGEAADSNGALEVIAQVQGRGGPVEYGVQLPKDSPNVGAINAVLKQLDGSGQLKSFAIKAHVRSASSLPTIELG